MSNVKQARSTAKILQTLRKLMVDQKYAPEPLQAYIVPSSDAHGSEYTAPCDERRSFLSGFTGSAGTCLVTTKEALLWTDGRYFIQAEQEIDKNWTLMKKGFPGVLPMHQWMREYLPKACKVGVDSKLLSYDGWKKIEDEITLNDQKLLTVQQNLVDLVWTDRPARPKHLIEPLPIEFSGKSVHDKLNEIRVAMKEENCGMLVVSALDEIAWTFNLRGKDIAYNPVFFAFGLIKRDSFMLFADEEKVNKAVVDHLICSGNKETFYLKPYEDFFKILKEESSKVTGHVWCSGNASYAIAESIPKEKILVKATPMFIMKTVKNLTEIKGMKKAHLKEGVALCCFYSWLEKKVKTGFVTECGASEKIEQFRRKQKDYVGPSFETISSVGPNGAIIHYSADPEFDTQITDKQLYLCDTGAQFKNGTTDVTRTMHFGKPTDYEMECYTRVLKGFIALSKLVVPAGIKGSSIDAFARIYLWEVGLDFRHSTGHGIGCHLYGHEGPIGIKASYERDDPGLDVGMFITNEPGYYEAGNFGIRIENVMLVVPIKVPYRFEDVKYVGFESVTMVPLQRKMMVREMLTEGEVKWINDYHARCKSNVEPLLEKLELMEVKEWLNEQTDPL